MDNINKYVTDDFIAERTSENIIIITGKQEDSPVIRLMLWDKEDIDRLQNI